MDETELIRQVRITVLTALTDLNEDEASNIATHVIGLGVRRVKDLTVVREEDLKDYLQPIPLRILLQSWKAIGENHQDIPPGTLHQQNQNAASTFEVDWTDVFNADPKIEKRLSKGRKLKKNQRRQVVSRVVNQVIKKKPGSDRKIFIGIVRQMKLKYKNSFKHELANGFIGKGSLVYYLQSTFDNKNRKKDKIATEAPNIKAAYGCSQWRLSTLPPGETVQSQEQTRQELAEMYSTIRPEAWNKEEIRSKMEKTYGTQRKEINKQAEEIEKAKKKLALRRLRKNKQKKQAENQENVDPEDSDSETEEITFTKTAELRDRWPFLFVSDEMLEHFKRLVNVDLEERFATFLENEIDKLIEYLATKKENKKTIKKMKLELDKNRPGMAKNIKLAAIVKMLTIIFREDIDSICQVIDRSYEEQQVADVIELPSTPLLVLAGKALLKKPASIFLTVDGTVVGSPENFEEGLKLLFGSYYCFNLVYAPKAQITLEFIQRCVVKLNPKKGNKRPNKTATELAGGRFSSKQTHAALQKLSSEYHDFFAEREVETTETESGNASSVSNE